MLERYSRILLQRHFMGPGKSIGTVIIVEIQYIIPDMSF